jgi:hypothetical protein
MEVDKNDFCLKCQQNKKSRKNKIKLGSDKKKNSSFNNEYNWSHRSIQTFVMSNPEKE